MRYFSALFVAIAIAAMTWLLLDIIEVLLKSAL